MEIRLEPEEYEELKTKAEQAEYLAEQLGSEQRAHKQAQELLSQNFQEEMGKALDQCRLDCRAEADKEKAPLIDERNRLSSDVERLTTLLSRRKDDSKALFKAKTRVQALEPEVKRLKQTLEDLQQRDIKNELDKLREEIRGLKRFIAEQEASMGTVTQQKSFLQQDLRQRTNERDGHRTTLKNMTRLVLKLPLDWLEKPWEKQEAEIQEAREIIEKRAKAAAKAAKTKAKKVEEGAPQG